MQFVPEIIGLFVTAVQLLVAPSWVAASSTQLPKLVGQLTVMPDDFVAIWSVGTGMMETNLPGSLD